MGDTKNFKRGKDHHNPVNTPLPEEYIVLVGGPTNTFNGYTYLDREQRKYLPVPHPGNLANLKSYIENYNGEHPATHDRYWANFLDPAMRLFTQGFAKPRPGDIVTIIVYLKPYLLRQATDWEASPYNQLLHRNSPAVRYTPEFDPYVQQGLIPPGPPLPDAPPEGPRTAFSFPSQPRAIVHNHRDAEREEVINHHILMRTTLGNTGELIRRPENGHHYQDYIHDIPRKIVFGPMLLGEPRLPNVLVRLLLINDQATFEIYLATGTFEGQHWIHPFDKHSEEDMGSGARVNEQGSFYDQALGVTDRSWAHRWRKVLATHAKTPNVNRAKIKVKRFDYFGHAGRTGFWMIFGWGNKKGEHPTDLKYGEFWRSGEGFPARGSKVFSRDASAWLWGCSLGGYYGPHLTDHFKKVTAAEVLTDFSGILSSPSAMPVPVRGEPWMEYDKKSPRPAPPPPAPPPPPPPPPEPPAQ